MSSLCHIKKFTILCFFRLEAASHKKIDLILENFSCHLLVKERTLNWVTMLWQTQCVILLIIFHQFRLLQHKNFMTQSLLILFAPFFVPYVYFGLRKPREIQLCSRLTLHGNPRMSVWGMLITNGTCAISGLSIVQLFQKISKTSPWNIIALLNILIT